MIVKGGFSTYGQTIGILMFKGVTPRVPGDLGHADTLDVDVCYEILDDVSFMDLVDGSSNTQASLISAAKRLESKGVKAITGDCGLLSRYQEIIASQLKIPFFSSSLILIPLIWTLQGKTGEIGIITGHTALLKKEHLEKAGVTDDIKLSIIGMENEDEFKKVVISGMPVLDTDKMEQGLMNACKCLVGKHPDVRSIVLECTNLPTYSQNLSKAFELPVYSIISLAKLISNAVKPPSFIN